MTEAGKMLDDVSKRLALMEAVMLSNFLGETLELTMDCMTELDKLEDTLQCNVQESSEKKGA